MNYEDYVHFDVTGPADTMPRRACGEFSLVAHSSRSRADVTCKMCLRLSRSNYPIPMGAGPFTSSLGHEDGPRTPPSSERIQEIVRNTEKVLKRHGFEVIRATDGPKPLNAIRFRPCVGPSDEGDG